MSCILDMYEVTVNATADDHLKLKCASIGAVFVRREYDLQRYTIMATDEQALVIEQIPWVQSVKLSK